MTVIKCFCKFRQIIIFKLGLSYTIATRNFLPKLTKVGLLLDNGPF